jgi:hypothetical protein
MRMLRGIILAVVLTLTAHSAIAANSNQSINIAGVLRDKQGALQYMPVTLTVNLYNAPSAAAAFYTQTFMDVPVDNGYFTVELAGSTLSFTTVPDAWVGIQVMGDSTELTRTHLGAAPYAFELGEFGHARWCAC